MGEKGLPYVRGQEHSPIESRQFSGFFVLSVQVLVTNRRQELVPIAVKDKNMSRLQLDKRLTIFPFNFIKVTGRITHQSELI
ncbi:hypothetical protein RB298_19785, partial [Priestia sp. BR_2]